MSKRSTARLGYRGDQRRKWGEARLMASTSMAFQGLCSSIIENSGAAREGGRHLHAIRARTCNR